MSKKKKGMLKSLLLLVCAAALIAAFFLPWSQYNMSVLGQSKSYALTGIESVRSLFSDEVSLEQFANDPAYAIGVSLANNGDVKTAMAINSIAILALAAVALLTAIAAVFAIVTGRRMKFSKILSLLLGLLGLAVLICSIVVVTGSTGLDLGIIGKIDLSVNAGCIMAAVFGLASMGVAFGIKK